VYTDTYDIYKLLGGGGNLISYKDYDGSDRDFKSDTDEGEGKIQNGKMAFKMGIPDTLEPFEVEELTDEAASDYDIYKDAKCTPSDTQGYGLDFNIDLSKMNMKIDVSKDMSSMSVTMEMVAYLYVDRDCVISATGGKVTEGGSTLNAKDIKMSLKEGWNVVHIKVNTKGSYSLYGSSSDASGTVEMKTGDLGSCKWVMDADSYSSYYSVGGPLSLNRLLKKSLNRALKSPLIIDNEQ